MEIVILLIKVFVVFNLIMGLASVCTWIERKGSALIQDRIGANRAGAFYHFAPPVEGLFLALRIVGMIGILLSALVAAAAYFSPTVANLLPAYAVLIALGLSGLLLVTGLVPVLLRAMGMLGVINTLLCDAIKALMSALIASHSSVLITPSIPIARNNTGTSPVTRSKPDSPSAIRTAYAGRRLATVGEK